MTRIIDGDTIVVQLNEEMDVTVRLVGVDTPETVHPNKPVEAFGMEAKRFLENMLKGERVYLSFDPTNSKTDKYDRMLCHVYRVPDGLFVNVELIRQGYAFAYKDFPCQYMDIFRAYERRAREAEKGLWAPEVELQRQQQQQQATPTTDN